MHAEIIYGVPVFPLNTVLFPSMPLPLHIFEERYRSMLRDVRRSDSRFCVSLIREGEEVGGDAEPYDVACLAEIVEQQTLPDGRSVLIAVGVERVKILTLDRSSQPYLTGSMELWPDESKETQSGILARARKLFVEYVEYILKLTGKEGETIPVPDEPDLLSYILATTLQLEPVERQRLLEIPGTEARLRAELEVLTDQVPLLRVMASTPRPPNAGYGQFSAN